MGLSHYPMPAQNTSLSLFIPVSLWSLLRSFHLHRLKLLLQQLQAQYDYMRGLSAVGANSSRKKEIGCLPQPFSCFVLLLPVGPKQQVWAMDLDMNKLCIGIWKKRVNSALLQHTAARNNDIVNLGCLASLFKLCYFACHPWGISVDTR